MSLRRFPTLPAIGILTIVYFIAGKLALKAAFLNASASPIWPPAGIALAALILLGYRIWPSIFVAAFLVNLTTAGNIATSLGIATGNTLEALCGAWLINRFANGFVAFERPGNVFKFSLAILVSTLISASIGVTSLALAGFAPWTGYSRVWLTWWLGDITGDLVVAPLIILWFTATTRRWRLREVLEVGVLFLALFLVAEVTFGGWFPITAKNYPISFLYGPVLIWLAFRFTPRETATGIFILASIGIWGTLHGYGPFVLETQNQSLLILQTRTSLLALTVMALAAGMAERRHAKAVIEEQKSVVEAANRTKDNFLAMLSHELRTPLTPVLAALDALELQALDSEEAKATLAMIRRNIELESHLIDDLLDLTRIATAKLQLQLESVDAHRAILSVVEMCQAEIDAKNLQFSLDLQATSHYVTADEPKFQQIIWNLLKNAIKFTAPQGKISISSSNPSAQSLTIAVTDTGIGIEPEMIGRIFNRFEQGDRSFQRRFGGLGLGLTISRSVAEAHGGSLIAESEGAARGARFSLTIKTAPTSVRATVNVGLAPSTRGLRILLVDDHPDTCAALGRLLRLRGHDVTAAHDIRGAIAEAEKSNFDLLISDVGLPDGTGLDLITQLRAKSSIRGIAISGFGMNGDVDKSIAAGYSEHLVKPVSLEKLEAAIGRATCLTS